MDLLVTGAVGTTGGTTGGRASGGHRRQGVWGALSAAALLATVLTACSGSSTDGGATTCNEWIALDLPAQEAMDRIAEGDSNMSDEQQAILKDALAEKDLATDEMNMLIASGNILSYCAPDGTGTRPNADRPISGALD